MGTLSGTLGRILLFLVALPTNVAAFTSRTRPLATIQRPLQTRRWVGGDSSDYYGEGSLVKEFATYDQLEELVKLAATPLPERPDGIVLVTKYTSTLNNQDTEPEYERMARSNPATIFLRCFQEFENIEMLISQAQVNVWPTFDVFYQGRRVARIEGDNHVQVQDVLNQYQFQNSQLDLFSEEKSKTWEESARDATTKTPRTTNRFVPGYDWGSEKGFFDDAADKAQEDFDYGNWLPNVDDER